MRHLAATIVISSFLAAGAPVTSAAQMIRGQVIDSVSGNAVPSGFVVLLDRDRVEVGRALADRDGRFVLAAPGAGTYRVRSERIGFRALTSEPLTLQSGSTLEFRLAVSALPVRLSDFAVMGETPCRALAGQGAALAVWDEARKALAAIAWGQRGRILFDLRLQDRVLSPELRVQRENIRFASGTGNRPFVARSPAELGAKGYTSPQPDGGLVFHGPDAEVLFSTEFLSQHCFHIVSSLAQPGMIGLAFEPVRARRLPDIAGTIWLDDTSAELRFLEYSYVNHGLIGVDREATGRVEFERLPDGYWIVRRWRIRLPVVERLPAEQRSGRSFSVRPEGGGTSLTSFVENGGEVLRAAAGGTQIAARAAASSIVGRVADSDGLPMSGVLVQLEGTEYQAVSSPDGSIRFPSVAEGVYTVKYIHPMVPALGSVSAPGVIVAVDPGVDGTLSMSVPGIVALLDQSCPGRSVEEHHSALAGGVRRVPGLGPVTGMRLKVTLSRWSLSTAAGRPQALNQWESLETETKGAGQYLACDLLPDRDATLYAISGKDERAVVTFRVAPDTVHQRNLGVVGDSVFVR